MPDEHEYPTDEELKTIEEWPGEDLLGWFTYIKSVGKYWPDESWGWLEYILPLELHEEADQKNDLRVYHISTGGWSGNEAILDSMGKNFICWHSTWYSHRVGGHYEFRVTPDGLGGAY